ncbi:MAG TPA: hypothetical protein VF100_01115 [Thermoanaerobaculia bacterium]
MTRATLAGGAVAAVLLLLVLLVAGYRALERFLDPAAVTVPAAAPSSAPAAGGTHPGVESHEGFLYGRITSLDGDAYEGRLRWGADQEAFWGDFFNGSERENRWLAHVPAGRLPEERPPKRIFGFEIGGGDRVGRLFMVRFGEIARIEARGREVRATLKSGTVVELDRFEASDFDDGVRVWDGGGRVVDLDSLQIRSIELLPTPPLGPAPYRLHGTVRTRQGDFTGFVQWGRDQGLGSDELDGRTADGRTMLRFDTIGSIARRSPDSALVTLLDGREVVLSGRRGVDLGSGGISVDDPRYGRVTISWDAFERVDLGAGGGGPAYDDFPPGSPLTGSVTTRAGRRLTGRLVYDVDESETTETLDASSEGVSYNIPFGLIAAIEPAGRGEGGARHATVTLHHGEDLRLEPSGDLRPGHAGMLIFVDGQERAEYVPWSEVDEVEFERPPAMYPPLGAR